MEVWDPVYLTAQGALPLGVWSLEAKGQLRELKAVFHFLSTQAKVVLLLSLEHMVQQTGMKIKKFN